MTDYYLQQVNFLDSESTSRNCISDHVLMYHDLLDLWNGYTCSYGNYNYSDKVTHQKNKKFEIEEILKDCQEMFPILEQVVVEDFEKQKLESWRTTFSNLDRYDQKGPIYKKPITIYFISDLDLKSKIKHVFDLKVYDLVYHPDQKPIIPWWVKQFESSFPNHGGDEEAYYLSFGFRTPQKLVSETAYKMKKVWVVLLIDHQIYKITLGRTAHA